MYGECGYLNLIDKLVEKDASNQISMRTISVLESKMIDFLKKGVTIDTGIRICPTCGYKEISIIKEFTFESDELDLCEIEI